MNGRRRPDTEEGDLPEDLQPYDYWKVLDGGVAKQVTSATNLTGLCWYVAVPLGHGDKAYGLGYLVHHTVREHEDGTISVLPGDGSSNSILVKRRPDETWHGYIRKGVFESC